QRWPIAFEAIHTTPTPAMTTAQVHVVRLRPDSVALSMMWPTRYGWNELHVKPSTPKNMAPASTWACLRASHSRSVTGPRSGGVPGSAKGRERTTTTVRTTTDTDPRFIHRPAAAGREGARNGLSSRGEYPADRTRDLRRGGGHRDPQGARRDVPLPLHGARHRRHAARPLRRARHQVRPGCRHGRRRHPAVHRVGAVRARVDLRRLPRHGRGPVVEDALGLRPPGHDGDRRRRPRHVVRAREEDPRRGRGQARRPRGALPLLTPAAGGPRTGRRAQPRRTACFNARVNSDAPVNAHPFDAITAADLRAAGSLKWTAYPD